MTDRWRWPRTEAEWRRAADAASALLIIEAVRVPRPGAVHIDRAKCEAVLARAHEQGIETRPNALGQYVAERAKRRLPAWPDDDLRGLAPR